REGSVFDLDSIWVYLGVFVALLAAGVGFPIPEELPIVGAGVLAGKPQGVQPQDVAGLLAANPALGFPAGLPWASLQRTVEPALRPSPFRWYILLPVCILGVVVSDGLLYGVGRLFGTRLLEHRWFRRVVAADKRDRIEHNFHRYGVKILLF